MKIAMIIGMVCAAMLACGGRPDTEDRLREAEKQLSIAEERLAAYEDAAATATARYECNMKIVAAMMVVVAAAQLDRRDVIHANPHEETIQYVSGGESPDPGLSNENWPEFYDWIEVSGPLAERYLKFRPALDIWAVVNDVWGGEC